MKQVFLLAAIICFGMAAVKFYTARMSPRSAQQTGEPERGKGWQTITAEDAKARLDSSGDVVLLDVRTTEEFGGGHIPGAVCLPNEDISPDLPLPFDHDAEVLVYCRSGRRSAEAAKKLADMGYTNVSDFGGILDWPYGTTTD